MCINNIVGTLLVIIGLILFIVFVWPFLWLGSQFSGIDLSKEE